MVTVAVRVWNSVVSASKPSALTATVEFRMLTSTTRSAVNDGRGEIHDVA